MDESVFTHLKPSDFKEIRTFAVQFLYQQDINQQLVLQNSALDTFFKLHRVEKSYHDFLKIFLKEVLNKSSEIDNLISKKCQNWKLSRIAKVDLAILRVAVGELLVRKDTDMEVIISEAMVLASSFGAENSCSFINGVLDPIAKEIILVTKNS
ncbi:MAG: transcription antitermination factor NusB [Silvanigrellaceae bacterium]|nr:transcription antitermination factor NusB [Silvanigrellaceae bacterium]